MTKLKKEPLRRKAKELGLECAILGILASESYQREKDWLEYGCNVFIKERTTKVDHYHFGPTMIFLNI